MMPPNPSMPVAPRPGRDTRDPAPGQCGRLKGGRVEAPSTRGPTARSATERPQGLPLTSDCTGVHRLQLLPRDVVELAGGFNPLFFAEHRLDDPDTAAGDGDRRLVRLRVVRGRIPHGVSCLQTLG